MTTLIITTLDARAKGSLAEYRRLININRRVQAGELAAQEELIDYIIARARTDDGSPVEEAVAQMSLQDFIDACRGIMGEAAGEMVPNSSTSSSSDTTS